MNHAAQYIIMGGLAIFIIFLCLSYKWLKNKVMGICKRCCRPSEQEKDDESGIGLFVIMPALWLDLKRIVMHIVLLFYYIGMN